MQALATLVCLRDMKITVWLLTKIYYLSFSGYLNDLFVFDHPSLAWTDISDSVIGSKPIKKCGCGLIFQDGKLYIYGGGNDGGIHLRVRPWNKMTSSFTLIFRHDPSHTCSKYQSACPSYLYLLFPFNPVVSRQPIFPCTNWPYRTSPPSTQTHPTCFIK